MRTQETQQLRRCRTNPSIEEYINLLVKHIAVLWDPFLHGMFRILLSQTHTLRRLVQGPYNVLEQIFKISKCCNNPRLLAHGVSARFIARRRWIETTTLAFETTFMYINLWIFIWNPSNRTFVWINCIVKARSLGETPGDESYNDKKDSCPNYKTYIFLTDPV